jgi:hypothetical protein
VSTDGRSRLAVGQLPAAEEGVQAGGDLLCALSATGIVRQPRHREECAVARGHDVRAEPRPPELDQRSIFPDRRIRALNTRMDREKRRARHTVLQARPRRAPQGTRTRWKPLVERTDQPSEGEDLRTREVEARRRQLT